MNLAKLSFLGKICIALNSFLRKDRARRRRRNAQKPDKQAENEAQRLKMNKFQGMTLWLNVLMIFPTFGFENFTYHFHFIWKFYNFVEWYLIWINFDFDFEKLFFMLLGSALGAITDQWKRQNGSVSKFSVLMRFLIDLAKIFFENDTAFIS